VNAAFGMIVAVVVSAFAPYQGNNGTESIGPSPSGKRVIFTERGTGADSRRVAVLVRDYKADGGFVDSKMCGGFSGDDSDPRRDTSLSQWVGWAGGFEWLDENRAVFGMNWRELQERRVGVVYWDGDHLGVLREGASSFDLSTDGSWIVLGDQVGEFDGSRIKNIRRYTTRTIVPGSGRAVGTRIYYETEENRAITLRSFDILGDSDREVCSYDGNILGKSRCGALAFMITRRQPGVKGPPFGDWGLVPGLPDILIIDSLGTEHWLRVPEEESDPDQTIRIGRGRFSPDGERLLVVVTRTNERTELTLRDRYYLVDWRKGDWTEIRKPALEGVDLEIFDYWCPDGVWWRTRWAENGKVVRGWARVEGFDRVEKE